MTPAGQAIRRVAATVTGRVQGVGYRYFARECASGRGLSGWVRNRHDGGVELEAQGPDAAVSAFLADLRAGPPLGRVTGVSVNEHPLINDESGFEIRW